MIKRILVALDPDPDTPVAIAYASEIARRTGATVTGLAVVDTEGIEGESRGGGIGSLYYAEKLRERLTEETRQKARTLIESFDRALSEAGIEHRNAVEDGAPFERIIEEGKYHDLLVMGRIPHFFYGHEERRTDTLSRVVRSVTCPVLAVGDAFSPVERVLVAYDGSEASAKALREFARLQPFGEEITVHIVSVYGREADRAEAELLMREAGGYLESYGMKVESSAIEGDPKESIMAFAEEIGAGAIVAGGNEGSMLRRWAFGSTTSVLLEKEKRPLFLAR